MPLLLLGKGGMQQRDRNLKDHYESGVENETVMVGY